MTEKNKEISRLNKSDNDKDQLVLLKDLIDVEKRKIESRESIEKTALENTDKSDERFHTLENNRLQQNERFFDKNDKHRTRTFYFFAFVIFFTLSFIFYLVVKENKFAIQILTHLVIALFSSVASYFYGKYKQ